MRRAFPIKAHAVQRVLSAALMMAVFLVLADIAVPSVAWAKYTEVSAQYPASRDLSETAAEGLTSIGKTIYPDVISVGAVVDGTYVVPAYTSSRMCNLYASQENATAKYAPNQVVLNVSGGVATVTFYLSGAYTAVYFGSAEMAAAVAPADGLTPAPSYITDGSDSYDTGHGPFSVQLSSLNTEFTFAVYNGGTKGIAHGLWYTRLAAVIATDDFVESCVIGVDKPSKPESTDPSPSSNDFSENAGGDGEGVGQSHADSSPTESEGQMPQASSPEPSAEISSSEAYEGLRRGKLLTIVNAQQEKEGAPQTVLQGNLLSLGGLSSGQIAIIGSFTCVVLGALAAIVRFRLQMRGRGSPDLESSLER